MITRAAEKMVTEALQDTPVVLIHGPRQSGKSTLSQSVGRTIGATYVTLDDPLPRSQAVEDPVGFLKSYPEPLIVDEVQRAPGLFLALKAEIDRNRRPGRFILTGSANVLALPKIADSLAGRVAIVDLLPLSQAEISGTTENFVERLLSGSPVAGTSVGAAPESPPLVAMLVRGGFPEPRSRAAASRREAWFSDYVRTLLERDVRDLANIEGLAQMPRVLRLIAARAGSALNVVDLSRDTQIPNTSLHRYLDLLQAVFLTHLIPAWSADQTSRLTKTPRTYLVDSGLLCYLRGVGEAALAGDNDVFDVVLRNFAAMELKKLCGSAETRPSLFHLRTVRRLEVDFVIETRGGDLLGIQIKATKSVTPQDVDGLKFLQELSPFGFRRGIVLYLGNEVVPISREILAVPMSALWASE